MFVMKYANYNIGKSWGFYATKKKVEENISYRMIIMTEWTSENIRYSNFFSHFLAAFIF